MEPLSTTFIVIAVGVTALLIWVAVRGGEKLIAERGAKLKNAIPAQARILAYQEKTGGRDMKGRFSGVVFTVEVNRPDRPPYQATTYWKVYPMATAQLQVGHAMAVKVDAGDPQVVYPDAPSVEYHWLLAQVERGRA
jgi:hypothetical protein